ncbi:polysaccharide deacetylase family protein [Marinobacter salarius]|uniref:polysaccharide deacetylase family protein n=1 Tax=Marinobacter salarius TaxID=1420917 RepID=UPI00273C7A78|nr:polysaccharide deacetylase family protein [Marinobacter salarius]MDP4532064.1 polysaccharide deacetylase family protein [Marinobacter salarius]
MFFTENALSWIESILLERFGQPFCLWEESGTVLMNIPGREGHICFDHLQKVFHQSQSEFPCMNWDASKEGYNPPIEGVIPAPSEAKLPLPLIVLHPKVAIIHYDIIGLTYWVLSRKEEIGRKDLDEHQRFPSISSHAYKNGYLERPIVDEWLIILGQVIEQVWPHIKLKTHIFSVKVSHDVDNPSLYGFEDWTTLVRMMTANLVKRCDIKGFLTAPFVKLSRDNGLSTFDPNNTFDWLMDVSEANNIRSAFYFICGRTDRLRDGNYEIEHPAIRKLMRSIHRRGHEIGLHPSYGTFNSPALIRNEAERLKKVCDEENITQNSWGGRMHYLRWQQPITLRGWDHAGMDYDSTLGYADRPGFRCGTCYEYPAFDPEGQQQLRLRLRPLIVMEGTIIAKQYLNLGVGRNAEDRVMQLKRRCRAVNGSFTLLWHNSTLRSASLKAMYSRLLSDIEFQKIGCGAVSPSDA